MITWKRKVTTLTTERSQPKMQHNTVKWENLTEN